MDGEVELRCSEHPGKIFAKIRPHIVEGNLLEVACPKCRDALGRDKQVLHRFNVAGELVETVIQEHPSVCQTAPASPTRTPTG